MITRTWYDPCPRCGGEVTGISCETDTIVSNPDSVLSIRDPGCPHEADPDADCTCTVLVNPAPDRLLDEVTIVGMWITMSPCGDRIHDCFGPDGKLAGLLAGWRMYQQQIPEPGSLGELMNDWAAHA